MNIVIAFMASGGAVENVFGDASFLRIFRLMRLTRLLRMARLIRMVPELLIMVKAVASAARSVGFTLILLGICLYVYAIVFRLLFDQTTAGNEYFPSVLMAMHKLFMHGTLLDSVSEMMTELLKESWIGFILGYFFIISPPWLNSSSLMLLCGPTRPFPSPENISGNLKQLYINMFGRPKLFASDIV